MDAYMRNRPAAVQAAGGDMAKAALDAGLVDKVADRQAFEQRLAQLGGEDSSELAGYKKHQASGIHSRSNGR
jgi:protease-4